MQKEVETYRIKSEQIEVTVKIITGKKALTSYELTIPQLAQGTKALLDEIRGLLVTEVTVSTAEMLDPNAIVVLKQRFSKKAIDMIDEKLPRLPEDVKVYLVGVLCRRCLA